ncbi:CynX/NimT family MFS transporter [Microbacterium sp.]|uniref:CynX/NimT family MFS transporter n=1 Tax=Microbacterium sp. TaxID=51671 RepID=UPI003A90F274
MGEQQADRRTAVAGLVVAVCLVAANMRPTITAVGPLLDQIGDDTGMGTVALGFITAVPLLAWAIVSPVAHGVSRRFGMSRTVLWALVLLAIGTVVRSLPGPTVSLWVGTTLIGVALAVANVLMPAVVKRDFPGRMTVMMSAYTALLGGVGALASGVAVPFSHLASGGAGWRVALLLTGGMLLPFALIAWAWATRGTHAPLPSRGDRTRDAGPRRRTGIWADPVAWLVAAYMGLQSCGFYMLVTWLAAISTSTGRTEVEAGFDVMFYQLFSLVGAVTLPVVLRGAAQRWVPALIPVLGVAGTIGLMVSPDAILVWAAAVGLFGGASLAMSLTLVAQRARDHDTASALSGMAQSVGYAIAAVGPVAFGALHAALGGWTGSLTLLLAVAAGLVVTGVFVGRDRFVLEPR